MNPTEFWYKLVDMTQSNTAVFTLGGVAITEKQLLWIVGISALIIVILIIRSVIIWILGASPKKTIEQVNSSVPAVTADTQKISSLPTEATTTAVKGQATSTPQELLTDTSDRKRSLHDYVTPDTIHAEVMKQTLNNDFPYNTLKPDPTLISTSASTVQTQTFGTPAPMLPPIPVINNVSVPPQVTTTPAAVVQTPVQVTAPVATPVTLPVLPNIPVQIVPTPAAVEPILPAPILPPIVPPVIEQQTPVTTTNSVLPPLPQKEPTAQMIVGVADNTANPITKSTFNPIDPIIP